MVGKFTSSVAVLGFLFCASTTLAAELDGGYRTPDAFYVPPKQIPAEPGALLRSEPLTGIEIPKGAQAWRNQYTTTFADGSPAVAVALVLAPANLPAGPRPVINFEHGAVGAELRCMPSLWAAPFQLVPGVEQAMAEGWVIVATDYAFDGVDGVLNFGIGEGEARSGLDAMRAARQMPELKLDDRMVVWGHSQGGHAALWTAIVGPRYAPELKVLGTAGIAPVTDFARAIEMQTENGGTEDAALLESYLALAYSHFYPDVKFDDIVRPEARDVVNDINKLCLIIPAERAAAMKVKKQLGGKPPVSNLRTGAFGERLSENNITQKIEVPLLIAQGLEDDMVLPGLSEDWVKRRCAAGQNLEYWTFADNDHLSIVDEKLSALPPALVQWTKDRFAGLPAPTGCSRKAFD